MESLALSGQLLLAVVFVAAGAAKLLDQAGSRRALTAFGVPGRAVPAAGLLLPLAELATAAALVAPPAARAGSIAALALLLTFIGGITFALSRGQAPDCHCFGQLHSAPAGRGTLARNGALAAIAAFVAVRGPSPVLDDWVSARTTAELTAVGTAVLAASSVALCVRFWRDNRRLRRDLAREREATVLFPPGLPQGARAPAFSLPDLRGETISLESLLARGQPVALVFVSPGCGPCAELMPELGRWQRTLAERLTIALLSSGSALDNHRAIEHGLTNVMLQPDADVMAAYRVTATPSVVIVSPDGRIASIAASGFPAVEPLIRLTLRGDVGRVPGVHLAAANGTRPKQPEPAR